MKIWVKKHGPQLKTKNILWMEKLDETKMQKYRAGKKK
jgi:hypothetical protein